MQVQLHQLRLAQKTTGFLNDSIQRIPNNEYYQTFSYSIKSRIPYSTWEDPVGSLNHISGYKGSQISKLSLLKISHCYRQPFDSDVETTTDIVGEASLHSFYDFDFVTEDSAIINGQMTSDEIFFENRILSDYFQSVGNRVLSIDDFSGEFFSNERPTKYSSIAPYQFHDTYNKIFTFVRDRSFTDERQSSIVSLLQHDGANLQEYVTMETYPELGYFDYVVTERWLESSVLSKQVRIQRIRYFNNFY